MLRITEFGRPGESEQRSPLSKRLAQAGKALRQTGRLMCGIPDYDGYVAHLRRHHPDRPVPSYEEFFRQRQDAPLRQERQRPLLLNCAPPQGRVRDLRRRFRGARRQRLVPVLRSAGAINEIFIDDRYDRGARTERTPK